MSTVAPASGAPVAAFVTVPWILPHDVGGVTGISTPIGVTECGESVATASLASYVPGWSTCEESIPTVTVTVCPGGTSNDVGSSDSQGTSVPPPHWPKPGRTPG